MGTDHTGLLSQRPLEGQRPQEGALPEGEGGSQEAVGGSPTVLGLSAHRVRGAQCGLGGTLSPAWQNRHHRWSWKAS